MLYNRIQSLKKLILATVGFLICSVFLRYTPLLHHSALIR